MSEGLETRLWGEALRAEVLGVQGNVESMLVEDSSFNKRETAAGVKEAMNLPELTWRSL